MKTILVTGGNKGIGLAICRQLGAKGYTVLMGSRDPEKGEKALAGLGMPNVHVLALDVSDEASVHHAEKLVKKQYGKLDAIINNAGIISKKYLSTGDTEEIKIVMETNFYGPMRVNAIFLPLLRKGEDPRIINMSSGMGAIDDLNAGYAGYRLSKAGLNAQTIILSHELQGSVKVFAMCPGWVKTDMGGTGASRTPDQGADTAVWLVEAKEAKTGKFYRDRKIISW